MMQISLRLAILPDGCPDGGRFQSIPKCCHFLTSLRHTLINSPYTVQAKRMAHESTNSGR